MDYATLVNVANAAISEFGLPVKITRDGTKLIACMGVFVASKEVNVMGDVASKISPWNSTMKDLIIPGAGKKRPSVGDLVSCTLGTFTVTQVVETNPGGVAVLYRLSLT